MKRFLKKRWHHLPIGIVTAVLVACLVAGSAFAWYEVTNGTAARLLISILSVGNLRNPVRARGQFISKTMFRRKVTPRQMLV